MKKKGIARALLPVLFALFLLPALPSAQAACDHYLDQVSFSDLIFKGRQDPGPGVEGYTGDGYCPYCGALCFPGEVIAALATYTPAPATDSPTPAPDPPADTPTPTPAPTSTTRP